MIIVDAFLILTSLDINTDVLQDKYVTISYMMLLSREVEGCAR